MRLAVSSLVSVALLALFAGVVLANQPDPGQSTWDQCIGRSPKNSTADPSAQYVYMGVLRDNTGAPVPNYDPNLVTLSIDAPCANPVANLHPDGPSNPSGEVIWGVATLNQGGGACASAGVVVINVDAQVFETLDDVRSPDEDGDTLIALNDLQVWQIAFVNQTPVYQGDLDCDGFIALGDLSFWQKHFVAP
jgi:hypothetical protein